MRFTFNGLFSHTCPMSTFSCSHGPHASHGPHLAEIEACWQYTRLQCSCWLAKIRHPLPESHTALCPSLSLQPSTPPCSPPHRAVKWVFFPTCVPIWMSLRLTASFAEVI